MTILRFWSTVTVTRAVASRDELKDAAYSRAARFILKGRYGRAMREVSRVTGMSPVFLSDTPAGREEWARGWLAKHP